MVKRDFFMRECNENGFEAYSYSRDIVVVNKEDGRHIQIPARTIEESSIEDLRRLVKKYLT